MSVSVGDVMREVRNAFQRSVLRGDFAVEDGALRGHPYLLPGDWVALGGSRYSDGIHQLGEGLALPGARDERFTGAVWLLAPPADFLRLCEEIRLWEEEHPPVAERSERFGAFSVSRAVDAMGLPVDWRAVFAARLLPWRKMFGEEALWC